MRNDLKTKLFLIIGILCMFALTANCDKDEDEEENPMDTNTVASGNNGGGSSQSGTMPQVGSINLGHMGQQAGTASLWLADADSNCDDNDENGIFGLAIGAACHMSGFASGMLLGNGDGDFNGDGVMDCDDLTFAGDDAGIMLHLLCGELFSVYQNVSTLSFVDDEKPGEYVGIGFQDFDDGDAAGGWNEGGNNSYPANIRLWTGSNLAALEGKVAIDLVNMNNGIIYVNDLDDKVFKIKSEFGNITDASGCAAAPGKSTCHWQEVYIYGGEGELAAGNPPNGLHMMIYADDKDDASFIMIEGKYSYAEGTAANHYVNDDSSGIPKMDELRTLYYQTVQKNGEIWGRFEFLDSAGAQLDHAIYNIVGAAAGFCQELGNSSWPQSCSVITYTDYTFVGKASFADGATNPLGDLDFTGAPTVANQLCQATGNCMTW